MPADKPMDLSSVAAQTYIETPIYCPFCGYMDIESTDTDLEPPVVYQDMKCLQCDARWQDTYRMVSVRVTQPPQKEVTDAKE